MTLANEIFKVLALVAVTIILVSALDKFSRYIGQRFDKWRRKHGRK